MGGVRIVFKIDVIQLLNAKKLINIVLILNTKIFFKINIFITLYAYNFAS